jgi:hypothetical protein
LLDPGPLPPPDDFHAGPAPFVVRLDLVGGRLELADRLDHRTAHLVHDAVSALLQTDRGVWVQDVEALSGCDHSGLRTIGTAYRRALRHARALTLVGSPAWLLVALGRLRLDHHLLAPAGMDGDPAGA